LTIVVSMAVRAGVIPTAQGHARLGLARRLGIDSIATATLCQGALLRAVDSGIPASDTMFVELAVRSECPLFTFDTGLLRAFPDVARRPGSIAGS